jgi:hypothetical protein
MAGRPHKQFARIATFAALPLAEASKKYRLARFTEDIDVDDMFGEAAELVFVAKGTVKLDRIELATDQYAGIYIVDGDLVVDGPIDFAHADGAAVLCVTGSVKAASLAISDEAHLWVAKDLVLSGPLVNKLSDAGGIQVLGKTKSVDAKPAKAGKPVKAATKVHPVIAKVAPVEPISIDEADKRFGLRALLDVAQCETPKAAFVHVGNASASLVDLREPAPDGKAAAYIIDGDLDVDVLAIDAAPMSTWGILVVTGNVRVKKLGCISDGRLWIGKNLDVAEVAVANPKVHVAGVATIALLVMRMMPPAFANAPNVGALVDIEEGPLASWASKWHAMLPARVLQNATLAPAHAGSSVDQLVEALVAGATLRA